VGQSVQSPCCIVQNTGVVDCVVNW